MSAVKLLDSPRYKLWKFFADTHDLHLLDSELNDIVQVVRDYLNEDNQ